MADETLYNDIITGIVETLRDNISDPDHTRFGEGKQFIYPDFPIKTASMPRISTTLIPEGEFKDMDLDSNTQHTIHVMQIDIWCTIRGSFIISSTRYGNTKLRDYLAGQVVTALRTNRHSLFSDYNIVAVSQRRPFGALSSGDEQLTRSMAEFEILYHQTYS